MSKVSTTSKIFIFITAILMWIAGLLILIENTFLLNTISELTDKLSDPQFNIVLNVSSFKLMMIFVWILYVLIFANIIFILSTSFSVKLKNVNRVAHLLLAILVLCISIMVLITYILNTDAMNNIKTLAEVEQKKLGEELIMEGFSDIVMSISVAIFFLSEKVATPLLYIFAVGGLCFVTNLFNVHVENNNVIDTDKKITTTTPVKNVDKINIENNINKKDDLELKSEDSAEEMYQKIIKKKILEAQQKIETQTLEKKYEEMLKKLQNDEESE